jgi:hypothetical protein
VALGADLVERSELCNNNNNNNNNNNYKIGKMAAYKATG